MEDLSTMTPAIVIAKIVAFEMSRKMGQEASSSSKGKALTCSEKKKMKGKQVDHVSKTNTYLNLYIRMNVFSFFQYSTTYI